MHLERTGVVQPRQPGSQAPPPSRQPFTGSPAGRRAWWAANCLGRGVPQMDWLTTRLQEGKGWLDALLSAPKLRFDESLRSRLPDRHGIYAISTAKVTHGEFLRVGRTKTAGDGLRQRIYQNHLMGNQKGNLRRQLVRDGKCSNLEQTKTWIRE